MAEDMVVVLNIALPVLYFLLVGTYGKAFFSDQRWAKKIKTPFLVFVLIIHSVYLAVRSVLYHHFPVTTVFEVFSALAFAVTVTYFFIERWSKQKETGYFILNIAFFFQLASSLFIRHTSEIPPVLQSSLFAAHVSSALVGYAAITISAAYGFFYLMLYSEMKATRFGVIYRKLPPLETIQRMTHRALQIVFIFLGIAIVFGALWLCETYGKTYFTDPKFIGTVFLWLWYAYLLYVFHYSLLTTRTRMIVVVAAFFFALTSMLIINFFLTGFHAFH